MSKLRVWWIPQVGASGEPFYIPVKDEVEGKKVLDMLAAYDAYQLQNRIKPDYSNVGGLQKWNDEVADYEDWYLETDDDYYDDVDDFLEDNEECKSFAEEVMKQVDWDLIRRITE